MGYFVGLSFGTRVAATTPSGGGGGCKSHLRRVERSVEVGNCEAVGRGENNIDTARPLLAALLGTEVADLAGHSQIYKKSEA